jgi:RNA polymerase sigma factor, sigma-70 family
MLTEEEIVDIYNRHVNTIYRVCYIYMKNKHDTEDMVQNTFIKLMNNKKKFETIEHEKAWLITTATNNCKNNIKHWWKKNINIDYMEEASDELKSDNTIHLILTLPNKYKSVIYMYYYEGYSTIEIAQILNMKEATVRSNLSRGRLLLKDIIRGEENEK